MNRHAIKPQTCAKLLSHLVAVEDRRSQWIHDQFPQLSPQRELMVELLDSYVKKLETFLSETSRSARASDNLPFVLMGSQVKVLNPRNQKTQTFVIIPFYEERVCNNHISILSPMGNALLLKAEGESVIINAPRGDIEWKIMSVKYPQDTSTGEE